jgi:hypothetical protein
MSITNDWIIGNANTIVLDNFRDSWTGTVESDVTPYASLCLNASKPITNATNTSPIVVTSAGHGLSTGDTITIVDVGGNGAAKGTFVVTVTDANTFSLNGSTGDGGYTGGGEFYVCVTNAGGLALALVSAGTYLIDVSGTLPLTPLTNYVLIIYCLGAYRDLYNEMIRVVARRRGLD